MLVGSMKGGRFWHHQTFIESGVHDAVLDSGTSDSCKTYDLPLGRWLSREDGHNLLIQDSWHLGGVRGVQPMQWKAEGGIASDSG